MNDDSYEKAIDMDRRLGAVHQQYNTEFMRSLDRVVRRHEQELTVIAAVMLVIIAALSYDDFRIRRLYEEVTKEPSTHHGTGSKSLR